MAIQVLSATGGIAATNCFLIADEASGNAVLFDAPDHTVGPLLDEARRRKWEVIGLWLTHGHFDHLADHALVKEAFPSAKVLIHRLDEPRLTDPRSTMFALPFLIPPGKADGYLEDEQELWIGKTRVVALHTPGHSPGHVMFYLPDDAVLVGGDLIIGGSGGRTDLPGADHATLERSIRRVMKLPGETQLLPGHGPTSTLAEEMQMNAFVREALTGE